MSGSPLTGVERDRAMLAEASARGTGAKLGAFMRLSGPGWLQSAITLGGGSLAGSLYLGVLGGTSLLWLQPLAMILGIVMLSAIGYVTLSTGERPFKAINTHVNPVLGWSWALATLAANIVWCMPQFALANGALQQNLAPGLLGADSALGDFNAKLLISIVILVITVAVTWSYGSGSWGIKLYELVLKLMVAAIVLCFLAVVGTLAWSGAIDLGAVFTGFIPNPAQLFEPAEAYLPFLDQLDAGAQGYWADKIVGLQLDKAAAAAATAVGINMTFLFPYSLLSKGWGKEFRGLAIFDLATGMLIPFVLATSCVVVASATQFHGRIVPGLVEDLEEEAKPTNGEAKDFYGIASNRLKVLGLATEMPKKPTLDEHLAEARKLPLEEQAIAAMLVDRNNFRLSQSLAPLTGEGVANTVFGLGVLGMTLSTISVLMLMSGFALTEMLGLKQSGWPFRLCCLASAVGVLGPFFWSKAAPALVVPTSVFGLILLPIAYLTFYLLMNQRSLLGEDLPRGGKRVAWNLLMGVSAGVATAASLYMVWLKAGQNGMIAIGALLALALVVQFTRKPHGSPPPERGRG
ncbi:divalent metal cation transporter [Pseudobythopirellula maris]|nr:divalent metal cation transporter [Pseudobythopirellula maris]